MDKVNRVEPYNHKKVGLKFETELEKMIHKKISGMRYFDPIKIEIDGRKESDRNEIIKAIKKSSLYNNVKVNYRWVEKRTVLVLSIDGM